MWNSLILEQNHPLATLTLNRPSQLNALNLELLTELEEALILLEKDKDTRVVVLTGAGDRAFVAGADIGAMQAMTAEEGRAFAAYGQKVFSLIEHMPQPVIAMVQGFALGGGCELALACDIRVASERARFGQPEVTLGITPGFGGTQRLPRLIGRGRAARLLYTGSVIHADEAFSLGLVDQVLPHDQLREGTFALARAIAEQSACATQQIKRCIRNGMNTGLEAGLAYESQAFGLCFTTSEQKKAMEAFLNKRR